MSRNGPISRELTLNHQDTKSTKAAELSPAHDVAARQIVDSAFTVHTTLGPGLLESVYGQCLERELRFRDLMVARRSRYRSPTAVSR